MNESAGKNEAICAGEEVKETSGRKRKILILIILLLLFAVGAVLFFLLGGGEVFSSAPAVTIETPDRKSVSDKAPFSLGLRLTSLGDDTYPAASFSISFDPSKLEFLGLGEGNVTVSNADTSSGVSLPEWSVNVERAAETGVINIMYLDMTGGKYAFSDGLLEGDNVLLYLNFRLRGGARPGDILELSLDDAVFAASDEKRSLAANNGTLKTVNGRIVIGE